MFTKTGIAVICLIIVLGGGLVAYNAYDTSQRNQIFQGMVSPKVDSTHTYTYTAPASWTSTDGQRYYAPDNSATISVSVFSSSDEKTCETKMNVTLAGLANSFKDFSSAPISVVGATKAVSIKGIDTYEQNNVAIYACGNRHSYAVTAIELNKNTPIPVSVQDSLKTFTVTD